MSLLLSAACLIVAGADATGDDKKAESKKVEAKFTAKCPVSGADAKKDQASAYKEKEVYFCCEKCKAAFDTDNAKFAAKANHQLVQTKQFRQTKCPLSGGSFNKEQKSKIAGVSVRFCCDKCKAKADAAAPEEQLAMVFSDENFKKAFAARMKKEGEAK